MSHVPVTSELLDRQPPVNLEAETGVLGSVMLLPDCLDEVALVVRAEDFYDDANRRLFEHMQALHDAGKAIDITLLVNRLKSAGDFEAIGGAHYLGQVSNSVPNPAHATYYAGIVQEKSLRRRVINASTDLLRDAYEDLLSADELAAKAEQQVFAITDRTTQSHTRGIGDILHDAMDRIDAAMRGEQYGEAVATGFAELDTMLGGGLRPSELYLLAARPGQGKSALALNICEHVAIDLHEPILFVSLEMSSVELADRMLCSRSHVDSHRMRRGTLAEIERKKLLETAGIVSEALLFVDDKPNRSIAHIASLARMQKRRNGLKLLVIDYLQLIEPANPRDSRQEQVALISRRLKGLSKELDVPVLALCQLSRATEQSGNHIPRLSHLRESGQLEADADVVMFVHRPEYYLSGEAAEQEKGKAEIHVAKQRNGPTGEVKLVWRAEYTRFEDAAAERYDEPEYVQQEF